MRPKVYLPQETHRVVRDPRTGQPKRDSGGEVVVEPAFDFTPAAEYGDIVVLVEHNKPVLMTQPIVRTLRKKMKDFSDEDFIIATGDPSLMMITAAVASIMNNGRFKLLKWDRRTRSYIPIHVNLNDRGL